MADVNFFASFASLFNQGLAQVVCENSWTEVPGNGQTGAGLAAVVFNDPLYVFAKGYCGNDRIYVNVANGSTWGEWREIPGNGLAGSD